MYVLTINKQKSHQIKYLLKNFMVFSFNLFFIRVARKSFYIISDMPKNLLFFFNVFFQCIFNSSLLRTESKLITTKQV